MKRAAFSDDSTSDKRRRLDVPSAEASVNCEACLTQPPFAVDKDGCRPPWKGKWLIPRVYAWSDCTWFTPLELLFLCCRGVPTDVVALVHSSVVDLEVQTGTALHAGVWHKTLDALSHLAGISNYMHDARPTKPYKFLGFGGLFSSSGLNQHFLTNGGYLCSMVCKRCFRVQYWDFVAAFDMPYQI